MAAGKLNPDLVIHFGRWDKILMFQMMEVNADFWTKIATRIPTNAYVASNGITVRIGASSSIALLVSGNEITISNPTFNFTYLATADNIVRDDRFQKAVSAIWEMVQYVNLTIPSIPHTCHYCFNLIYREKFCKWVDNVGDNWDIDVDSCAKYNVLTDGQLRAEVYEF